MKRRALFVGVDDYTNGISALSCAQKDAQDLHDLFNQIGYDAHIRRNVETHDLIMLIDRLTSDLTADDLFLFFFAGHGYTDEHDERRLACKGDFLYRIERGWDGVGLSELKGTRCGARCRCVFILDACRTTINMERGAENRGLRAVFEERDRQALSRIATWTKGSEMPPPVVINSCQVDEVACEFGGHGLFTNALLEVVKEAWKRKEKPRFDKVFTARVQDKMVKILERERSELEKQEEADLVAQCSQQRPEWFCDESVSPELIFPETTSPKPSEVPSPSSVVVCPECGKYNVITDTFKCRVCCRDHLCLKHYLKENNSCDKCLPRASGTAGRKTVVQPHGSPQPGEEMTITLPGGAPMTFCWCPAGSFLMGSPESEEGRDDDETRHRVTLTQGFWMGKYEVTQAQWKSVMGTNPSRFKDEDCPVECVSWDDCQKFVRKVNAGGAAVALPTEAQWEYACRAGTTTPFSFGSALNGDQANCDGNYSYGMMAKGRYREETASVGSYAPNGWGLHDMHGNVWEWCSDWYGAYGGDTTDPIGLASGSARVVRGGGWNYSARHCRSARRGDRCPSSSSNYLGFRLCCPAGAIK